MVVLLRRRRFRMMDGNAGPGRPGRCRRRGNVCRWLRPDHDGPGREFHGRFGRLRADILEDIKGVSQVSQGIGARGRFDGNRLGRGRVMQRGSRRRGLNRGR